MRSALFVLVLLWRSVGGASEWPQLQHDPQRTGYTPETVRPPFKVAWYRNFPPERVSRQVQAVVYAGKVFVGTKSGNLYALGARDGKEAWKFPAGGAILHTAACADGKVVVAALDGVVYAVRADTGELAWKFKGEEGTGFSTAPLLADRRVFVGQRGGVCYALNLKDGALSWRFEAGAPIFNSAAFDGGQVFFCDESLHVHCLDAQSRTHRQPPPRSLKIRNPKSEIGAGGCDLAPGRTTACRSR